METKSSNILVIDDDPVYRRISSSVLQERFNVFTAQSPSEGFAILRSKKIDYLICDYLLPEMNGLEVMEIVKNEFPGVEIIMISDSGDMDTVINALRKGAVDYFRKPFTAADIWMSIERTNRVRDLKIKLNVTKDQKQRLEDLVVREFGVDIIGVSPKIEEIKQQMKMVAQTPDTSVLILGESGTGKELVARGIHNLSNRRKEFFGAVNMSAIPEALFESEFFGHKKGSFTGAVSDKAGWFETCNKGSLFLDEIGEMTQGLQVKLLRVLEDKTFVKVGTQNPVKYDVRIIAATNKPIKEISNGKDFRLDLFHRVGTFIINIPPLRERKEDIPYLIDYYRSKYAQQISKEVDSIHPDALTMLMNYSFPGNIRELRNLVERAVILCNGHQLLPENFNLLSVFPSSVSHEEEIFDLEILEKKTIEKALEKCNYNKSDAAKLLHIEWNALYRRIQKYNIPLLK